MRIPVIGTVFTDIKGHPYEKFIPDGRNAGYIEQVHGGVARNIAEDLAELGAEPVFVSLVTPDGTGNEVISHLEDAGVDARFVHRAENGSGTWLAIFDESGNVFSSISVRADLTNLPAVLDEHHEDIFADADIIILEIDIDTAAVEKVFEYAKKYGKKVCCAVATMSHALDKTAWLKETELFILNQQEAGMLFDEDLNGFSPEELAALLPGKMKAFELKNLIVTMSSAGSVYASINGTTGICPAKSVPVVDTTGAGDSYCAGAVLAYASGHSLAESCAAGTEVSAAVVASASNVYKKNDAYSAE